ncbi:MAG TPA: DnaA regulatory inactivator Hda [Nevskiaceae bacterium]|nr:DnaA regulatory inactivator Hda [Nevskiaceae bacterium]
MRGHQLALPVQLRDSASFDTYYAGPNVAAVDALRAAASDVLLYGAPASGRSHLLQAVARVRQAAYLPLAQLQEAGADVLAGFDQAPAICLDDVDAVSGERGWCTALLRLIDAQRARGSRIVLACAHAPERMDVALPDLRTRLSACAVFGLKPLSDDDRAELLRERAHARGMELAEDATRWLLAHLPRDAGSLVDALETLDRASLREQRRLTLPFVQACLRAPSAAHTSAG